MAPSPKWGEALVMPSITSAPAYSPSRSAAFVASFSTPFLNALPYLSRACGMSQLPWPLGLSRRSDPVSLLAGCSRYCQSKLDKRRHRLRALRFWPPKGTRKGIPLGMRSESRSIIPGQARGIQPERCCFAPAPPLGQLYGAGVKGGVIVDRRGGCELLMASISVLPNWPAKMSDYGDIDVGAERAGKTSGPQQFTGRACEPGSGGNPHGSERTPHQAHPGGL